MALARTSTTISLLLLLVHLHVCRLHVPNRSGRLLAVTKGTAAAATVRGPPVGGSVPRRAMCHHAVPSDLLRHTLIPYACVFGTNPVRLARAATDVSAVQLRSLSARAKEAVARGQPEQGLAYYALRDCAKTVSSAVRLAKQSAAEVARLDMAGGNTTVAEVRWAISNAQTWLSAAMSNEATCAEGIAPWGGASAVAKDLVAALESTSVALTMVNGMPR